MRSSPRIVACGLAAALGAPAWAYETDQLTDRHLPLEDAAPSANAAVNALLDRAITATNEKTRCEADDERTRRVLARQVYEESAARTRVRTRGGLRAYGFGLYSAWLESAPLDRREFAGRGDIYGSLELPESVILSTVGTCSTVSLAGVLVGTDKVDHFFATGYRYAVTSDWGRQPERAIRYGTRTERFQYGLLTSNAFSWADLRANWDGYRFYVGLLTEGSLARRGDDGCVERVADFDWADWVVPEWDEVLNPPTYGRNVQRALEGHLDANADAYCESFAAWGEGYPEHLAAVFGASPEYAHRSAPARRDPWELDRRCGAVGATASSDDQATSGAASGSGPSPKTRR